MRSLLFALLTLTVACQPNYSKTDNVDNNPNNSGEPSSEPSGEPSGEPTDPDNSNDPDNDALRCCYGIEMMDFSGDGWERGLLSVVTEDGVYANVSLPEGYFEGFREVCIDQGKEIAFSWNMGLDNDDVGLGIFSFEGEDFYYGEHPESGILAETISSCPDDLAVDQNHQEFDSTQEPDVVDPDPGPDPDPDYTDGGAFAGQYIGVFEMVSQDTGEQLCLVDMVMDIDENGQFAASEVCSFNGHNANVSHIGQIYTDGLVEDDGYGNTFAFGYLSGIVDISDDTGMIQIESEFYGECFLEANMPYINVYWDSVILSLDGTIENVYGQLYYPY